MTSTTEIPQEYIERCKTYLTTVQTNDVGKKPHFNNEELSTVITVDILSFLLEICDKLSDAGLLDLSKFDRHNDAEEDICLEDLTPSEIVCLAHFYRLKEITGVFTVYYEYEHDYEYFVAHDPSCCDIIDNWTETSPHNWEYEPDYSNGDDGDHECGNNCCCHKRYCHDCFHVDDLLACLQYDDGFSLDTTQYTLSTYARVN